MHDGFADHDVCTAPSKFKGSVIALKQLQQDDGKRVEDEIIRKPNRIYWWEIAWLFRLLDVNS